MIDREKQYRFLINQLEREVKELYWLYNLFFVGNGLLAGYRFSADSSHHLLLSVVGILISLIWFTVFNKQRIWRDGWIRQIIKVENNLLIPMEFRFFSDSKHEWFKPWLDSLLFWKKGGIAKILIFLPACFLFFWIYFLFSEVPMPITFV